MRHDGKYDLLVMSSLLSGGPVIQECLDGIIVCCNYPIHKGAVWQIMPGFEMADIQATHPSLWENRIIEE